MKILTLTTDKGFNDYYLASYKGLLYKKQKDINIIDISTNIESFNIQQGSFMLANSWRNFPVGTVHHFRVGEEILQKNHFLVFEIDEQIFVLPDNGVITMLFPNERVKKVYRVNNELSNRSNSEFLATIISYLFNHSDFSIVGVETNEYHELMSQQPISSKNYIRGIVQHIDGYGNLITNISKKLFDQQCMNREFQISLRAVTFEEISTRVQRTPSGDFCKFNEMGYLKICVYQGNASELYNLNVYDSIQIDFKS